MPATAFELTTRSSSCKGGLRVAKRERSQCAQPIEPLFAVRDCLVVDALSDLRLLCGIEDVEIGRCDRHETHVDALAVHVADVSVGLEPPGIQANDHLAVAFKPPTERVDVARDPGMASIAS